MVGPATKLLRRLKEQEERENNEDEEEADEEEEEEEECKDDEDDEDDVEAGITSEAAINVYNYKLYVYKQREETPMMTSSGGGDDDGGGEATEVGGVGEKLVAKEERERGGFQFVWMAVLYRS